MLKRLFVCICLLCFFCFFLRNRILSVSRFHSKNWNSWKTFNAYKIQNVQLYKCSLEALKGAAASVVCRYGDAPMCWLNVRISRLSRKRSSADQQMNWNEPRAAADVICCHQFFDTKYSFSHLKEGCFINVHDFICVHSKIVCKGLKCF